MWTKIYYFASLNEKKELFGVYGNSCGTCTLTVSVSNVKTVKERSTNVLQTFQYLIGMKPKHLSSFLNLVHESRYWTGPNRNNQFSIRQIWERYQNVLVFQKRYSNVCPFVFEITRVYIVQYCTWHRTLYNVHITFIGHNGHNHGIIIFIDNKAFVCFS